MYVRLKKVETNKRVFEYLQIVESFRNGKAVRQKVLYSLGRMDRLKEKGKIDGLIQSLSRFSDTLKVETTAAPKVEMQAEKIWGPTLVFSRLWKDQQFPEMIDSLVDTRRYLFDVEKAMFTKIIRTLFTQIEDAFDNYHSRIDNWEGLETLTPKENIQIENFLSTKITEFDNYFIEQDLKERRLESETIFLNVFPLSENRIYDRAILSSKFKNRKGLKKGADLIAVVTTAEGWPIGWRAISNQMYHLSNFQSIVRRISAHFANRSLVIVADQSSLPERVIMDLLDNRDRSIRYIIRYNDISLTMEGMKEIIDCKKVISVGYPYLVAQINKEKIRKKISYQEYLRQMISMHKNNKDNQIRAKSYNPSYQHHNQNDKRQPYSFLMSDMAIPEETVARLYHRLHSVEAFFQHYSNPDYTLINKGQARLMDLLFQFMGFRLKTDMENRLKNASIEAHWVDIMTGLMHLKATRIDIDGRSYHLRSEIDELTERVISAVGIGVPNKIFEIQNDDGRHRIAC